MFRVCASRAVIPVALAVAVLSALAPVFAHSNHTDAIVSVRIEQQRLTLHATDASLRDVIVAIADTYPFLLQRLEKVAADRRDWQLDDKPVVAALRNLLRDYSYLMYFKPGPGGEAVLARLDIVAGGNQAVDAGPAADAIRITVEEAQDDAAYYAVNNLESRRDESTLQLLAQHLQNTDNQKARLRAFELLAEWDSKDARKHILSVLGDEDEAIQLRAISVINKWHDEQSLQALGQVIHANAPDRVRIAALQGIAEYQDVNEAVMGVYLNTAARDRDPQFADMARELISKTGVQLAPEPISAQ